MKFSKYFTTSLFLATSLFISCQTISPSLEKELLESSSVVRKVSEDGSLTFWDFNRGDRVYVEGEFHSPSLESKGFEDTGGSGSVDMYQNHPKYGKVIIVSTKRLGFNIKAYDGSNGVPDGKVDLIKWLGQSIRADSIDDLKIPLKRNFYNNMNSFGIDFLEHVEKEFGYENPFGIEF